MIRDLTDREREVLLLMIARAPAHGDESSATAADRLRWREQAGTVRAGRPCGCGTCPSVELVDEDGRTPEGRSSRVVLSAGAPGALVLLFVDDDRLSYLELAPDEDEVFEEFPPAAELDLG